MMATKEKMDSKNVVRTCEKCKQASLLLSQEVMGSTTVNVIIKANMGVVAERWSCQNCDYYFEVTIEKPRPSVVWLAAGILVGILGLTATAIVCAQLMTNTRRTDTTFTFIFGLAMLIGGIIATYIGYRMFTLFKRNFIVDGLVPPPMNERTQNLPLARRNRKCTCQGTLINVGDVTRSFNMIPTGVIYTFKCNAVLEPNASLDPTCNKTIILESTWRTIIFLITALVLLFVASLTYENGIETKLGWTFFIGVLLTIFFIIVMRCWRIYLKLTHPRI
jgi:hypothetical protein